MSKSIPADVTRIPVFIGVTGHRDIRTTGDDLVKMKKAIKSAINEITRGCSYTDFIVLTSLAAGADQVAAEAVVEMASEKGRRPGSLRFAAVLPMEQNEYFTHVSPKGIDFTPEQRRNAENLMRSEHCAFVHVIANQTRSSMDNDAISQDDLQFREAARFISDNSFAGIALWDGILKPGSVTGTGPTVRDFLHGKAYHRGCFDRITIPETRPIYHIYTPRAGMPARRIDYRVRPLFPEPLLETGENWFTLNKANDSNIVKHFNSTKWHNVTTARKDKVKEHLDAIDCYNQDAIRYDKTVKKRSYALNKKKSSWNADTAFHPSGDNKGLLLRSEPEADLCEKHYMTADALSQVFQSKRKHNIWWIVWIACFAYASLTIFSDFIQNPLLLVLYLALLALAFFIRHRGESKRIHSRFVDYRALAEGLRVQYYWYAADVNGEDSEPAQAQNYYLRRQKGQIEWIRHAIRAINLLALTSRERKKDLEDSENREIEPNVTLDELKNVSDLWLGRMDVREDDGELWYNPTYGLKQNGQVGYFLATSLKSTKGINLPARPRPSANATAEQKKDYRDKVKKEALRLSDKFRIYRLLRVVSYVFILASMIIAVALAVLSVVFPDNAIIEQVTGTAIFVAGLLPIFSMILREASNQMGYKEDVERYSWYYNAFKRAVLEIDEVMHDKDFEHSNYEKSVIIRKILFEIGKEALIENADWVMLNAKRTPEVPSN